MSRIASIPWRAPPPTSSWQRTITGQMKNSSRKSVDHWRRYAASVVAATATCYEASAGGGKDSPLVADTTSHYADDFLLCPSAVQARKMYLQSCIQTILTDMFSPGSWGQPPFDVKQPIPRLLTHDFFEAHVMMEAFVLRCAAWSRMNSS